MSESSIRFIGMSLMTDVTGFLTGMGNGIDKGTSDFIGSDTKGG